MGKSHQTSKLANEMSWFILKLGTLVSGIEGVSIESRENNQNNFCVKAGSRHE